MFFPAVLVLIAAQPPSLRVRTDGDALLPCPAGARFSEAVRARLADVRLATEGEAAGDDLTVSFTWADGWTLDVRRANSELAMSRQIPQARPDCEQLADTALLIFDRYLADIEWRGRAVVIEPLPKEQPPPPAPADAPPVPAPSPPPRPVVPEQPEPLELNAGATIGLSGRMGVPLVVRPGATIDGWLRWRGFRFSLWLHGEPRVQEPVKIDGEERGTLYSQLFVGYGTGAICLPFARIEACGGAALGTSVSIVSAEGERLYRTTSRTVWLPQLGGFGAASWTIIPHLDLIADLIVAAPLGGASLVVEGTDAGYSSPSLESTLSVRVGWRWR